MRSLLHKVFVQWTKPRIRKVDWIGTVLPLLFGAAFAALAVCDFQQMEAVGEFHNHGRVTVLALASFLFALWTLISAFLFLRRRRKAHRLEYNEEFVMGDADKKQLTSWSRRKILEVLERIETVPKVTWIASCFWIWRMFIQFFPSGQRYTLPTEITRSI